MHKDSFSFSNFLRAKQGAKLLGIGLSTFWLWVKQGKLPSGVKLGNRVTVWKVDDIMAFVDQASKKEV